MENDITFSFCGGGKSHAKDLAEVRDLIQQLTFPKATLLTNPAGLEGYLDFRVLDDKSIEMEILEHYDDDFAKIDIPMAVRVLEITMTDTRDLRLRQKLDGLLIQWLS